MKTKLLFLSTLLSLFSVLASAHDIAVKNADDVTIYYKYINDGTELEVTYRGSLYYLGEYTGNVVIPEEVSYDSKLYKVSSIGWGAFYGCSGLNSITIPNSVTSIKTHAFNFCI